MTITFEQLQEKAAMMIKHGKLADRVDNVLDLARINADDTIYVENVRPVIEYDQTALNTLAMILSHSRDEQVQGWFRLVGFSW